eukprot:CAMPEP_0181174048 /NCGR_PEP_ID=MMETSP1096-20121128/3325_1 /TAXON_ID=156174 ORGANISM="Chrysochromulina ericina, Strain CCMP281" /NCGR_SAMPLE_ID=MMETSP1096 /ASSEMBLY_ACC=CAM_ASM_000453 /LENGTH=59 /DNA_ID=CAMNT_0023261917 /DNA_START=289 /DNA_END=469 /DNA_ORIENTATION=+
MAQWESRGAPRDIEIETEEAGKARVRAHGGLTVRSAGLLPSAAVHAQKVAKVWVKGEAM